MKVDEDQALRSYTQFGYSGLGAGSPSGGIMVAD